MYDGNNELPISYSTLLPRLANVAVLDDCEYAGRGTHCSPVKLKYLVAAKVSTGLFSNTEI
jgi:hypothetical protein